MDPTTLLQNQKKLTDLFHSAPISINTGMTVSYNHAGEAIFEMPYNPKFDHALGGIHGGIIATMIDNAGWFTVAPHFNHWIATVEFSTRLHEPVMGETLYSQGNLIRLGKRLSSARMEVRNKDGRIVASGSGTFTLTKVPISK